MDMSEKVEDKTTILVVDDERGPRESLRMILSPRHRVLLAESGAEALEFLRTTAVDAVTVDLNMPGMRGDELIRTIRDEFPYVEIVVITGYGTMETAVEGLRQGVCDYISKPFDVVKVIAAMTRAFARRRSRSNLAGFLEGLGEVLGKDRDANALLEDLEDSGELRARLRAILRDPILDPVGSRPGSDPNAIGFLELLAETIESRDTFMRGHARRVAFYAGLLADRLCLSTEEREHLRLASFLHDLGKVGVSTEVLASEVPLRDSQRDELERHSAIGERLVRPLGISTSIASAIRHHHERFDGSGYPDGVRGDEIPLAARIVAVADAFDAMTCDRPYRETLPSAVAVGELRKHAGSHFDPDLVEEFAAIVETGVCELGFDMAERGPMEPAGSSTPGHGGSR
jgi:putative two-component system response regulator